MKLYTKKLLLIKGIVCLTLLFTTNALSQQFFSNYEFELDLTGATEAPKFDGTPTVEMPKKARNMGVEGTMKAVLILNKNGNVGDITFEKTLPHGMEQSFIDSFKSFKFQPATRNGTPLDVRLLVDLKISAVYDRRDKNVKEPKIIDQPEAIYPPSMMSDGRKDSVEVDVVLYKDGKIEVVRARSSMPRAFDDAATEAAKKLKFEPAMHKKSKKPITMQWTLEYKFKP